MTCARAYRELARLSTQGWLVEIRSGIAGQVLVIACRGNREIRQQGDCVADIAGAVLEQARRWHPAKIAA